MSHSSIGMGEQDRSERERFENELKAILRASDDAGILLRVIGSLAFQMHCQQYGYLQAAMGRVYTDIDFAAYRKQAREIKDLMADLGYGADGVEVRRSDMIHVLALRDGENLAALFLQRALDRSQRARSPHADGRRGAGKQHQLPQRQHRKGHTFSHAALAFLRVG